MCEMYDDFKGKHPGCCCYETYRKAVADEKISFVKLGEEECEECMTYEQHLKTHENDEDEERRACDAKSNNAPAASWC